MKHNESGYKVLSTGECIRYIEQSGINLQDDNWNYGISSGKGLIYTLANGEFVLVPTNFSPTYPSIIFANERIFDEYIKRDFFPIGKDHMSFLEAHSAEVKELKTNKQLFASILFENLGVSFLYKNVGDIEIGYNKLLNFINDKKNSEAKVESVIYCFGLSVLLYLEKENNFKLELQKRYEIYNPYYYPLLNKEGSYIDVLTNLCIALKNRSSDSFKLFLEFIQFHKPSTS